ncbi:unnamed protein product [Cuscuta epithymum]|uniref:Uncharacterized protein n=1 Tax=Cuscuta epithymum TaxID=186058 RepID=A0AAV0FC20_9ASTE|nr:unnamed protein product [Cuscuta epithymum]
MAMRGVGGPLLCIGDLLSDVGEDGSGCDNLSRCGDIKTPSFSESCPSFRPSDLPKLFQENYEKLNEALAGTDHSWTALTLEVRDNLIPTINLKYPEECSNYCFLFCLQ